MIAQIVPIQRLRRNTNWWSYKVKANQACSIGSLVEINFRNQKCLGIVWSIEKDSGIITNLKEINSILTSGSLLTPQHLRYIEWLSIEGVCSLSSALYAWLPSALRKYPLTAKTLALIKEFNHTLPKERTTQTALILPNKRDEQTKALENKPGYFNVFWELNPTEELKYWLGVRTGSITTVSGRERAIFAPWNSLKRVLIFDPEDISFYHEQTPYLSLAEATKELAKIHLSEIAIKSYLPTKSAQAYWETTNQTTPKNKPELEIIDLSHQKVLNPNLINEINKALTKNETIYIVCGGYTQVKNILKALELKYQPSNLIIDSESQSFPLEGASLTVFLMVDLAINNQIFANRILGFTNILRAIEKSRKTIIQSFETSNPIFTALQSQLIDDYILQDINSQKQAGLSPFGKNIVCSYPIKKANEDEANKAADLVYTKISTFLDSNWQISYPLKAKWRQNEYFHLILHAKDEQRVPAPLREYLVNLPKPWKVQNNPWYLV